MPSWFVIAFLPRSSYLLILWLQSTYAVILDPKKIKSVTVSTFSPSISHEVLIPDTMILVFLSVEIQASFFILFFHSHQEDLVDSLYYCDPSKRGELLRLYWECILKIVFKEHQLVQFSSWVVSNSLWLHELQHARPPCPSPTPGVYSNSHPLSQWCHPTISSSVIPFSSCLESFPASGSFPMSQLFTSGGQSIGVSAST